MITLTHPLLGVEFANTEIKIYELEKEIKDLIESNLRQRVLGNTNPVKLGRCFEFLSNYYGFHRGGDRKSNTKLLCLNEVDSPQTQVELAQSYGITQQTMNNYMRMASMIPELEDLVETEILAPPRMKYLVTSWRICYNTVKSD